MESIIQSMQSSVPQASIPHSNPLSLSSAATGETLQNTGMQNPCTTCQSPHLDSLIISVRILSCHQIALSSDSIVIGGPNSPIANGSLISGIEVEIDYAYTCAEKIQTENIASIDVKEEAMRDFIQHRNEAMQAFVWSGNCRSWYVSLPSNCDSGSACSRNFCNRYKNGKIDGPVIGPWVGSSWHFNEALEKPRFEDYEIEYLRKNRFAYLGYGRTLKEELGESTAEHLTEDGVSC